MTPKKDEIEAAARAAGYTIRFHAGVCKGGSYEGVERLCEDGEWRAWRPWANDGDAFRLMCALAGRPNVTTRHTWFRIAQHRGRA